MNAIPNEDYKLSITQGSGKALKRQADADKVAVTDRGPVWQFRPEDITILPGFNTRLPGPKLEEHIEHLKALIKANGFLQDKPLKGMILNIDGRQVPAAMGGHCRLEAIRRAKAEGAEIETIPFIVAPPGTNEEDMTAEIVSGNQGLTMDPYEIALVAKRLVNFGWPLKKIAEKWGYKSTTYVEDLLTLVAAPREIRNLIECGQVSSNVAIEMLKKHGDKALGLMVKGITAAASEGKTKATAQHMPGAKLASALKSRAPIMHKIIVTVSSDPNFKRLNTATQDLVLELLERLTEAEGK